MVLAERLRQSVENLQKPNPASTTGSIITISIGMTTTVPNREGPWQELQLIATAEKGLVQAAEAGRNRVVFEPGGKPVTPV
jgi:two-component system chemotaxis family response regulator WspR